MKKILKGKQIKEKGGINSGEFFRKGSLSEIMKAELSEETNYLSGVVISSKFRSPAKKFLQDLDDMTRNTPNVNQTVELNQNADLLTTPKLTSYKKKDIK